MERNKKVIIEISSRQYYCKRLFNFYLKKKKFANALTKL